jgi:hypothetical protein
MVYAGGDNDDDYNEARVESCTPVEFMYLRNALLTFVFFCCRYKSIDSPRNTLRCHMVDPDVIDCCPLNIHHNQNVRVEPAATSSSLFYFQQYRPVHVIVRSIRLYLYKGGVPAFTLIENEQNLGRSTIFGVQVHFYVRMC